MADDQTTASHCGDPEVLILEFRRFLSDRSAAGSERGKNLRRSLNALPAAHRSRLRGYRFVFENGDCLDGDPGHVGSVDTARKVVQVSSPWRYSREFCLLHEVAHVIYASLNSADKKRWNALAGKSRHGAGDVEEAFCMAYAARFSENPPPRYDRPSWKAFISSI